MATKYIVDLQTTPAGRVVGSIESEDSYRGAHSCQWEDCTCDAIYCEGHAYEAANAEVEGLRRMVEALEARLKAFEDQ